ncbi:MAG: Threonine-tRNA ligase [Parcubacteria group bacterium GW2011_GWC1_43_11b]|uniref:Threonine--tRNA ligase n=2 Tax=Candidatus Vogeliibacteriota TaxID=1817922 RepID=A0A1G2QF37_9BACT|nr:MAG: Threonine-tRNA ligase [Parcubacteria group bacterium GW2011_GWB1_42_9]KKS89053.1 MAG: Threonine-tRNA ligase [Parcubacteria group bacterium GW2011_GWC1_43_11b]KKT09485.1 MAG: Threonine-tRNA ligase [Parcubacteria group bacterium GW2011_GWA1_43_21]OHA59225.1 MAG: threonine--tRNA ligase [Candidatus Vogelbacteria bacterium RIFOXYB1_FULL_42_16]
MKSIENIRHSLAHLLAMAVKQKYPEAKLGIGPAIDNGFYYDFDFSGSAPKAEDLAKLEKDVHALIKKNIKFEPEEISVAEARKIFADEPYKLELIEELEKAGQKISIYRSGDFVDLCVGPHIGSTEEIDPQAFKLDRLAGAYWRGSEKNKMLTRIYGLVFATKEELAEYIEQMAEAEKRDHRKLGKELEIFTFDDDVGPGLPLWLPNGGIMIEELENLAKTMEARAGYVRVRTPHIAKEAMYLKSGHLPYYEESMFPAMEYEGGKYYLKAMNCPHHHKIFAVRPRSYKELPLRLAEYGTCYRHEKSGELFGLMRVRSMQMNDAHIYCTEDQFASELKAVNDLYLKYFRIFGIEKYIMRLSTHSPTKLGQKYVDEPELWLKTEKMVRDVLTEAKIPFVEVADEAAFYGPKIDVQVWSAIGREFTLATNQVDFAVPKRFGLTYVDADGQAKTPLCIHRAPLSTHERLIGFLIEHYAGHFPVWLSPIQVKILPISEKQMAYAQEIYTELLANDIRAELDDSNESLGKKIRGAKTKKIPYLIIVGEKEMADKKITVESLAEASQTTTMAEFLADLQTKIKNRD